jgi:hypothetical protein
MSSFSNNISNLTICPVTNNFGSSYFYYYVNPFFAFFGSLQGLLITWVLAQKTIRSSQPFFQYSLLNSALIGLTTFILGLVLFSRCDNLCSSSNTFWAETFEKYGLVFISQSLQFSASLIQISASTQLYLSVSKRMKKIHLVSPKKVMIIILLVSFLLGLSLLFVTNVNNVTCINSASNAISYYYRTYNTSNTLLTAIATFILVVSNYIFVMIMVLVNILLYVELRRIMNRKRLIMVDGGGRSTVNKNRLGTKNSMGATVSGLTGAVTTVKIGDVVVVNNKGKESKQNALVMVLLVSTVFSVNRLSLVLVSVSALVASNSIFNVYLSAFSILMAPLTYTLVMFKGFFFSYR